MEHFDYGKNSQRKTEKAALVLYSIYSFCILLISLFLGWKNWISFFIFADIALSWIVYVGEYRTYRFRAAFTACMMQLSILLYATQVKDLFPALSVFIAVVIFTGLYAIVDLLYMTMISAAFLFFFHGVIIETIQFTNAENTIRTLLLMGNVFVVECVMYLWVKKRDESDDWYSKTIEVLNEAQRSKDDFLANVSHEIRTPINTICGMSEIVLKEEDPRKMKEEIFSIQTAGRNLLSVVSDILDFSELQSENVELEEEAYNITSTINDIINMTMARKGEKHIELIVDCDANMPCRLLGDEKKIRRVIMNLVDNAIKFTADGYVSIIIAYRKESYGINLIVTVKDTGIGMKEESLEKLFTSFNQVDTKRNRQEGGIGLGLAISNAIVQKMDGIITVKSKFEKGTAMKVVIPQKVLDEKPISNLENREKLNVAIYIDMEQFKMTAIRDEYSDNIFHMIDQLGVRSHVCRNLAELKRRVDHEQFTHIFISLVEYQEDQAYFDELSVRTKLIIVIDRPDEKYVSNTNILRIYKPFYILPIVSVLNGNTEKKNQIYLTRSSKFTAPDAHILVVDDNVMNIKVIESLLGNYRIKVSKATSGREALEKIETMDYDFVFMDHMMPEMDGIETLHRIRKKAGTYYRNVPIIALTANAVAGMRERFLAEGFADYLEKPIESSVLERVLKRNIPEEKQLLLDQETEDGVLDERAAETEENGAQEEFTMEDLDMEKGMLYCGGKEGYMNILQQYSQSGDENRLRTEQLYEQQDWENYTIMVHGIKSSMLSIGATKLSELARHLELAGKKGNLAYIRQHHGAMVAEYKRVIKALRENPAINPPQTIAETAIELPVLEDAAFEQQITRLEEAMYELDGERMLELLTELQKYQYHGTPLEEPLASVRRKIEMSDYMSAVEALTKIKDKLKNSEEGGRSEC